MIGGSKNAESIRRVLLKQHGRLRRERSRFMLNVNRYASFHSKNGSENTAPTSTVVLLRHGQSLWNKIPTFTGWCDVPLTDLGIEQAEGAARLMKERGYDFDLVYSSELQRAHKSAEVVLETMNSNRIEPRKAWELNERQYVYRTIFCMSIIRNNQIIVSFTQPSLFFFSGETTQLWCSSGLIQEESGACDYVWR